AVFSCRSTSRLPTLRKVPSPPLMPIRTVNRTRTTTIPAHGPAGTTNRGRAGWASVGASAEAMSHTGEVGDGRPRIQVTDSAKRCEGAGKKGTWGQDTDRRRAELRSGFFWSSDV